MTPIQPLNQTFSLYLDVLRVISAFLVVIWHLSYPRISDATMADFYALSLGPDAVLIFFVLSGFVIAYAAEKEGTLSHFIFNRLTRLYSVLIPILFVTIAIDALGQLLTVNYYDSPWYQHQTIGMYILRGLTFTNEWFSTSVRLGSNGPLWSLSYEVAYYCLFAGMFFLRGVVRILWVALIAFAAGIKLLILLPAWWIGVAVYKQTKKPAFTKSTVVIWLLVVQLPVLYSIGLISSMKSALIIVGQSLASLIDADFVLGYSDYYLWHLLLSLSVGCHLLGVYQLCTKIREHKESAFIRHMAGTTFTVYVLHYPVLHFLNGLMDVTLFGGYSFGRSMVLLCITFIICYGFALITELQVKPLRRWIKTALSSKFPAH